jgi:uncharacterized protein
MVEPEVRRITKVYLRKLRDSGIFVDSAVVFGSRARGQSTDWSDIDMLVVSPRFDGPRTREDMNQLWRIAANVDARIEPLPCGVIEWDTGCDSALVETARREGQVITLADEPVPASP